MIRTLILAVFFLSDHIQADTPLFSRDIAPILQQKCLACHNLDKSKGGYRVDSFSALFQAGKGEKPGIVPGKPDESELLKRLITSDADDRMPRDDDPLPREKIEMFRHWIASGATLDKGEPDSPISSLLGPVVHPSAPGKYPFPAPILSLAFNPGATELYVGGHHELMVWSVQEPKLLRRVSNIPRRVHDLSLNSSGTEIFLVGGSPGKHGELARYTVPSANRTAFPVTSSDELLGLALSPSNSLLAAAGSDNSIHLFDLSQNRKTLVIQQHADWVMDVNFSPDGKHLVSASRDRTARVYDAGNGNLEAAYVDHNAPVYTAQFTADGKSVISAGRARSIHLWKIEDAKKSAEFTGFKGDVWQIIVDGNSLFSACADGVVRHHLISEKKLAHAFDAHSEAIFSLAFDANTKLLAAGARDGLVRVWNSADGTLVSSFTAVP